MPKAKTNYHCVKSEEDPLKIKIKKGGKRGRPAKKQQGAPIAPADESPGKKARSVTPIELRQLIVVSDEEMDVAQQNGPVPEVQ